MEAHLFMFVLQVSSWAYGVRDFEILNKPGVAGVVLQTPL